MARFEKYTTHGASAMLFHNSREFSESFTPTNIDIDRTRTPLNYSLCENASTLMDSKQYFKNRLSEIFCYGNKELKTLGQWVVTAPADLASEQEKDFFRTAHDYMNSLYGVKNCIQSVVHRDEGVKNDNGEIISGKSHLHYCFIPAVKNQKFMYEDKRGCISKQNRYKEKCCIHSIITPSHLKQFNAGLQKLCDERGIKCTIANNATSGGNRTVAELKSRTKIELLTKEKEKLKQQIKDLENSKERSNSTWTHTSGWSKGEKSWEKDY